jgi:hypothetical protein
VAGLTLALALGGRVAHANERVVELTTLLTTSSSEKARISAVAALSKLDDKTAMKPLVGALADPSAQVRAVAAAALGKLGHKAALPALKAAADDQDATVRARAHDAAVAVAKANDLPDPWPAPAPTGPTPNARTSGGSARFGRQARALSTRPDLYVTIKSAADDSPGKTDRKTRQVHGELLKSTLTAAFKAAPRVTTLPAEAQQYGLDPRQLDLSVTRLEVVYGEANVEIDAQLRLAISDTRGKMLSFLSGGATIQIPRKTYDARYLPALRKEALENAMRGMFDKVLVQLRARAQS